MAAVDPRLVRALREQLEHRTSLLNRGARRVGWKLGLSERDSIGGEIGVGYLTSATCLASGATYLVGDGDRDLRADLEIAVELRADVDPGAGADAAAEAIARYGAALEICDVAPLPDEPHSVVATNDFHRSVVFGVLRAELPYEIEAELWVNGAVRASGPPPRDIAERLRAAARVLAAVGERLRAGDRIITGLIVNTPIASGDDVVVRAGALGTIRLRIAPSSQSRS